MSGEALRHAATYGNAKTVASILQARGNPCSTDEYGLTALHYAAWNGHIECTKYLLSNARGVEKQGQKCSLFDCLSVKNYTPLHLVAHDCPLWAVVEITHLLLLFGIDRTIRGSDGYTAEEIARLVNNQAMLKACESFDEKLRREPTPPVIPDHTTIDPNEEIHKAAAAAASAMVNYLDLEDPLAARLRAREEERKLGSLQREINQILAKYRFTHYGNRVIDMKTIEKTVDQKFEIPRMLYEDKTTVSLPEGMQIYEHHISPLTLQGFATEKNVESFKLLDYVEGQAQLNLARRTRLMRAAAGVTAQEEADIAEHARHREQERMKLLKAPISSADDTDPTSHSALARGASPVLSGPSTRSASAAAGVRSTLRPKVSALSPKASHSPSASSFSSRLSPLPSTSSRHKGEAVEPSAGKAVAAPLKDSERGPDSGEPREGEVDEEVDASVLLIRPGPDEAEGVSRERLWQMAHREEREVATQELERHPRLVPHLPDSRFQSQLPWEDDMIVTADKSYLRKKFKDMLNAAFNEDEIE